MKLSVMWWGSDGRAKITKEALDLFTKKHPNITVTTQSGGFQGYFDKLATQAAGGDAPDVFQMNEWNLREYAQRGIAYDLSSAVDTSRWVKGAAEAGIVNGKLMGANIGVNMPAVNVNPSLFELAGIPIPDDKAWTWKQFADLAKTLTSKLPSGNFGARYGGSEQNLIGPWLRQRGVKLFSEDSLSFTAADVVPWFEYWQDLVGSGAPAAAKTVEDMGLPAEQTLAGQGKIAMWIETTNTVGVYEKSIGKQLRQLRLPTVDGKASSLNAWNRASMYWCVSAKGKNPAAGAALVDFFLRDPDATKVLGAERGAPPNTDVRKAIASTIPAVEQRTLTFLDSVEPDLATPLAPPPMGAGEIVTALTRVSQDVVFRRKTAQQAAEELYASVKGAIKS